MKKLIVTALMAFAVAGVYAQDTTKTKTYKNEFGLDVTGFLRQFQPSNNSSGSNYFPVYYLTYRRHFGRCNLRAGLGGAYSMQPANSPWMRQSQVQINARVGWEWTDEISKRWQVFYGIDYRQGFSSNRVTIPPTNSDYITHRDINMVRYGIAPVLGFRFRVNERLSLATEASLNCYVQTLRTKSSFEPVSPQTPSRPNMTSYGNTNIYTSFAQPLSIFFTFDI